jgi:hypothetical protein
MGILSRFDEHGWVRSNLSAYLDRVLAAAAEERLERHLAGCEVCATELASVRATMLAVRSVPEFRAPRSFALTPRMVEARTRRIAQPSRFWTLTRGLETGAAAAAVLFVALIVGDITTRGARNAEPSAPSVSQLEKTSADTQFATEESPAGDTAMAGNDGVSSAEALDIPQSPTTAATGAPRSAPTAAPTTAATASPAATGTSAPDPTATATGAPTYAAEPTGSPTERATGSMTSTPGAAATRTAAPPEETPEASATELITMNAPQDASPTEDFAMEAARDDGDTGVQPGTTDRSTEAAAEDDNRIGWRIAQAVAALALVTLGFLAIRARFGNQRRASGV